MRRDTPSTRTPERWFSNTPKVIERLQLARVELAGLVDVHPSAQLEVRRVLRLQAGQGRSVGGDHAAGQPRAGVLGEQRRGDDGDHCVIRHRAINA
jgi:hypothetical protein